MPFLLFVNRKIFETGYSHRPDGKKFPTLQTINSKLDAWLTFFSSDKPADILKLVQAYPEFRDLYAHINNYH